MRERKILLMSGLILLCGTTVASCSGDGPTAAKFGPPAVVSIEAGQDQSATVGTELPIALAVKVVDEKGRPVRGQSVNFRVVSGGGSVLAGMVVTSDSGIARDKWTLGTAVVDSQRVSATVTGLPAKTFQATARAAAAAGITVITPAAGAAAGVPFTTPPRVRLIDAFSNTAMSSNATVTLAVSTGGTLLGQVTVTAQAGEVTFVGTGLSGKVGDYTLTYSAPGLTSATQAVALRPGPVAGIDSLVSPSQAGTISGAVTPLPIVRVVDASGNGVPLKDVKFTRSPPSETPVESTVATDSLGRASPAAWTLGATSGWNGLRAAVDLQAGGTASREFRVYGFPVFERLTITGTQPGFTAGFVFNRARNRVTVVHPNSGLYELAPDGGEYLRLSTSTPGAGRVFAAVHEDAQQLLIISEQNGPAYWDYAAQTWRSATAGNPPAPRQHPALVYDPLKKRVLLYGGIVKDGSSDPVADVYAWDGMTWTNLGPAKSGPRAGHGMAYAPDEKRVYVHGGVDFGNPLGGRAVRMTWFLDEQGVWDSLGVSLPENVASAGVAYDEVRKSLVVAGGTRVGTGGYGLSSAIWELIGGRWIRSSADTPIGQRAIPGLVYVPGRTGMILFGSEHAGWNDVWFYGPR